MLEGKLITIPALGNQNKGKSSFTGSGLFVLMSQCGNNNELALQHGGFLYHVIVSCKRPITTPNLTLNKNTHPRVQTTTRSHAKRKEATRAFANKNTLCFYLQKRKYLSKSFSVFLVFWSTMCFFRCTLSLHASKALQQRERQ